MKVFRSKCLISFNRYNELKDYLSGKSGIEDFEVHGTFPDDTNYLFEFKKSNYFSRGGILDINVKYIDEKGNTIEAINVEVNKISKLTTVLSFKYEDRHYIISIDKDVEINKKNCISRLNIVKWNSLTDDDYVKNLVAFNNLSNNLELMETVFALLTSNLVIGNKRKLLADDIIDNIKEKFLYYGYDKGDAFDVNDLEVETNSEDILYNMVSALMYELYHPNKSSMEHDDMKRHIYYECVNYLDTLQNEKVI